MVNYAEAYPSTPDKDDNEEFVDAFKTAFKPSSISVNRMRTAHVASELLTPFFARRLVGIDWSSKSAVAGGVRQLGADIKLFSSISKSVAPAIEHGLVLMRLFIKRLPKACLLWTIIRKNWPGFSGRVRCAASAEQEKFLGNVGRALQEGIAKPTDTDIDEMTKGLPEDVSYTGVISSASIAHILEVEVAEARTMAVKIKRGDIGEALEDNVRAYQLLVDVAKAFVDAHADDGEFRENLDVITRALPFALKLLENDTRKTRS